VNISFITTTTTIIIIKIKKGKKVKKAELVNRIEKIFLTRCTRVMRLNTNTPNGLADFIITKLHIPQQLKKHTTAFNVTPL